VICAVETEIEYTVLCFFFFFAVEIERLPLFAVDVVKPVATSYIHFIFPTLSSIPASLWMVYQCSFMMSYPALCPFI
jgi:hypothetical protein